ncbi:hypothetical protein, partial [Serratia marcescens]|uniref:hypothetical protein n=1 Tax=Serratia marcescens TaxID=615 RepID=UPI0025760658
ALVGKFFDLPLFFTLRQHSNRMEIALSFVRGTGEDPLCEGLLRSVALLSRHSLRYGSCCDVIL